MGGDEWSGAQDQRNTPLAWEQSRPGTATEGLRPFRQQARRAAVEYAAVIAGLGIDTAEAVRIVQAALTQRVAEAS